MVYLGTNQMLYGQWITPGAANWSIGVELGQALTAPALIPVATTVNDHAHAQGLLILSFWPADSYVGMFTQRNELASTAAANGMAAMSISRTLFRNSTIRSAWRMWSNMT